VSESILGHLNRFS